MKVFGKELGETIKIPVLIDQYINELFAHHKNEEQISLNENQFSTRDLALELCIVY